MFACFIAFFHVLSLGAATVISPSHVKTVIQRDIVILGGGASGAHAAVLLRDSGEDIAVVEEQDRLGGHVASYIDPITRKLYDYGVNSYTDSGEALKFFARFNITVQSPVRRPLVTINADFNTGRVTNYSAPASADTTIALEKYLAICEMYKSMITPSYANFPNTTAGIPEDLLLKFSDFVEKYNLRAAVPRIFQVTGLGMGNLANQTTLYVMQAFDADLTRSLLGKVSSFVPVSGRKQDLYDAIAKLLGDDVFLSSMAIETHRTDEGVEVLVRGADGQLTLIRAKKLLIAFEPTLANLEGIDIDAKEKAVFSRWEWSHVHVGVVSHPSLRNGSSLANQDPSKWLSLPETPSVGRFDDLGDGYFRVLVTGPPDYNSCKAKSLVNRSLEKLADAGTISRLDAERIEYKAWSDHGPMHLRVSASDISDGHITDQYGLQGHLSTYYTGAGYCAQFTTRLWEYNSQFLVPMLLAGL
ncbi:beta-cyclopiazonate dehydrogenase [Colletotrichum spaethianum]|uniref:Beta-cyclopiazonate dehydrogenase n=1 Tax=Colletotrichum spaethianum TaxID=700344 RepID=A0AA37PG40_9PEZI|nr:beta-cyclopiazonate dehydrogenase [Colletotrichum spaethianum]GKT51683.1 beta-cyclopiazonate dehydrogenase [Colletotrichum spaethianum]